MEQQTDTVYILTSRWSTTEDDGAEILSVSHDLQKTIAKMRESANKIRALFPEDYWTPDYTEETDRMISLVRDNKCMLWDQYFWEIHEISVED